MEAPELGEARLAFARGLLLDKLEVVGLFLTIEEQRLVSHLALLSLALLLLCKRLHVVPLRARRIAVVLDEQEL